MADPKTALADQLAKLAPQAPKQAAPRPMPAEQDKPERWPARIQLTASHEMKRDLKQASMDDGIEVTALIRAMITLWQDDPKLRAKVGKLARDLR